MSYSYYIKLYTVYTVYSVTFCCDYGFYFLYVFSITLQYVNFYCNFMSVLWYTQTYGSHILTGGCASYMYV